VITSILKFGIPIPIRDVAKGGKSGY